MDMTRIFLITAVLTGTVQSATECFQCVSTSDPDCSDPFRSKTKVSCDNQPCFLKACVDFKDTRTLDATKIEKVVSQEGDTKLASRGCGSSIFDSCATGHVTYGNISHSFYCCNTNNCNRTDCLRVNVPLVAVLALLTYSFSKYSF